MGERPRLKPVAGAVIPAEGVSADLAGVLHDLRSPLTVIAGACFALRRAVPTVEALRLVERIEGEASRIAERTDEAGRLAGVARPAPSSRQGVDLGGIVREVVERYRVAAGRTGVEVDLSGAMRLPVRASVAEVERLVENLVANAVRHAGRRGRVVVELGRWGGDAIVRVTDDGAAGPLATGGAGWGVGLHAARGIARAHGGDVVREPAPVGAVFRIRMPLTPGAGAPPGGRAA